jgi:hypothetical protein
MVYVTTNKRPFVYGSFRPANSFPSLHQAPFAVEILREYSANEFIGKLYEKSLNTWVPVQPFRLPLYDWYAKSTKSKAKLFFFMEGSGRWEVQHFREESDEMGLYVAVALKLQ